MESSRTLGIKPTRLSNPRPLTLSRFHSLKFHSHKRGRLQLNIPKPKGATRVWIHLGCRPVHKRIQQYRPFYSCVNHLVETNLWSALQMVPALHLLPVPFWFSHSFFKINKPDNFYLTHTLFMKIELGQSYEARKSKGVEERKCRSQCEKRVNKTQNGISSPHSL